MPEGSKREREERAMDALLVSLLRRVDKEEDYIDPKHLPELSADERAASISLGTDFVERLLAGERPIAKRTFALDAGEGGGEVALSGCGPNTSFNRAEAIDPATAEELERHEKEILERKRKEKEGREGESET